MVADTFLRQNQLFGSALSRLLMSGFRTTEERYRHKLRSYKSNADSGNSAIPPVSNITMLGTAATASANTATTVSATHVLTSGSNRIAVVFVSFYKGTSFECTGVTYGGVAMTKIGNSGNHTTVYRDISAWYLLEASLPANGSKTVTATVGSSSPNLNIHVFTIQDATQAAYEQTPTAGTYLNSSSATSSINITTVAANAWAFSGAAADASSSYTHGTDQIEITDTPYTGASSTKMTMTTSYEEVVTPGAVTQTDTVASGATKHVGVAFSFAPFGS